MNVSEGKLKREHGVRRKRKKWKRRRMSKVNNMRLVNILMGRARRSGSQIIVSH